MSTPPPRLRVVVADAQAFYRQGLAKLLRDSGMTVVAEAATGREALAATEAAEVDVMVVDLDLPGMSGTEVARRLLEGQPAGRVLIVSATADEDAVADAILAGAAGYVLKEQPVLEVIAAIREIAAGQAAFSPAVTSMLLRWTRARLQIERAVPSIPLSDRELEVLRLVAEGRENHEIAKELFIGSSTVKNHVSSILAKLQVDNRVQAAVRAVRDRLV